MSRHARWNLDLASPRNLRLGALVLVFIAINQVDEPLVDATVVQELLYWFVRISVMMVGLWTADAIVARLDPERFRNPAWLRPVILVSAIGLLPFALAEILIEPYLPMRPEYVDDELWAFSPLLAFLSEYATIVTIVVPVHLILWLIIDRRAVEDGEPAEVEVAGPPNFLQQSSVRQVDDILALQAEEHYIRIYTKDGAELVHYRFRDAVTEMPDQLGAQVHRSWWVAERAIQSAKRGTRRWQLNLETDVSVPVSDSYVAAVREKGWLKRKSGG